MSAGSSGSEKMLAQKVTRPAGGEGFAPKIMRPYLSSMCAGMPEFPFLTLTRLPPGFLVHLGGMVGYKYLLH